MELSNLLSMAESVVSAEGYSYVWAVVITGLAVVFIGLIILIAFVWAMGKIFTIGKNTKKPEEKPPVPAAPVKPAAAPKKVSQAVASADDDEVIAVIAAAVAAMGEAEGKNYKVKSVRAVNNKPSRSAWAMAGLQSNTAPF